MRNHRFKNTSFLVFIFTISTFSFYNSAECEDLKSKIHINVDSSLEDFYVPNGVWKKLQDSKLYDRIGKYTQGYNEMNVVEFDYVFLIKPIMTEDHRLQTLNVTALKVRKLCDGSIALDYMTAYFKGWCSSNTDDVREEMVDYAFDSILNFMR